MSDHLNPRVNRLIAWIRRFKRDLCDANGKIAPTFIANATGKHTAYWSDVLRGTKSFGSAAAREVEEALGIPHLHLEGALWPFEEIDQDRFERLTDRQKGRVEQKLIETIAAIEAEHGGKRLGPSG
jgi:hypothetical protein